MAKSKSTSARRGEPEFERGYLLNMGHVKPATGAPELEQIRGIVECCDYLLPIAQHTAKPGNAPEMVATWLIALRATAREAIAKGGMGGTPMSTQRDEQAHSGVGGVAGPSGANSVGVAPAGSDVPIPQSADVTKVQPIKPFAA
ncbi:hypothetical protein [Hydrogenophaga sp.]|uniref:hypothetical protein n=1 Tax=Hydrogenophaga sp. TaxID=1904254 RepID=UPI002625321B|nr:hypothetical protein [Hydrogenophaga sp.]MCW5652436.1 hypothetical protein [Hydrogenophaga sp.]